MRRPSKSYEIFGSKAVEALFKYRNLTASVKHDVFLNSKALDEKNEPVKRQIDIFAQFNEDGQERSLVIEAKNWKSSISVLIVDSLIGKLSTLETLCHGMIIAPSRFQKGAVTIAKQAGLILYILRKVQPEDFVEGKVPSVKADIGLAAMKVTGLQVRVAPNLSAEVMQGVEQLLNGPEDIQLFDRAGEPLTTLRGVLDEVGNIFNDRTEKKTDFQFGFSEPISFNLKTGHSVPLHEIKGVFSWEFIGQYNLENRFEYLLASPTEKEILFLDSNMEVKKIGDELSVCTEWIDMKKYFPEWFPDDGEKNESAS